MANDNDVARVPNLRIAQGEHLLVTGPSGSGKSCLLRAIAGIWRFGEGSVSRPSGMRVLALPQRRYFPLGTLRQAVTYPTPAEQFTDAEIGAAMETAGIGRLAHRLEEEADWSMVLSGGEQQRIGFARVLLHRPDLILLDEAVSTFEDADARDLYQMLFEKLPHATVISVGRSCGSCRPAPPQLRSRRIGANLAQTSTRRRACRRDGRNLKSHPGRERC